jgi:uncharacterized protein YPO0396
VSDFIDGLRLVIQQRASELRPLVDEYENLLKQQEITDAWQAERDALKVVKAKPTMHACKIYISGLEYEAFTPTQLADHFGQQRPWAKRVIATLGHEGYIEEFGKGAYRKRMIRTGQARLRVATM